MLHARDDLAAYFAAYNESLPRIFRPFGVPSEQETVSVVTLVGAGCVLFGVAATLGILRFRDGAEPLARSMPIESALAMLITGLAMVQRWSSEGVAAARIVSAFTMMIASVILMTRSGDQVQFVLVGLGGLSASVWSFGRLGLVNRWVR